MGPQAIVGFDGEVEDYMADGIGSQTPDLPMTSYANTLNWFYYKWMNGKPLAYCLSICTNQANFQAPIPTPAVKEFNIGGAQWQYVSPPPGNVVVWGHSGLTVSGCEPDYDGYFAGKIGQ